MTYNVNEIFYSLQGEGSRIGKPCVFVRFQGCNLRCSYCDTMYAVEMHHPYNKMTFDEIVTEVEKYNCNFIEFTGGEPLIQKNISKLIDYFIDKNYEVAVETNGSIDISQFNSKLIKIIDVKCPSSGMSNHNRVDNLKQLSEYDEIKFVIGDRDDYLFAKEFITNYNLMNFAREIIFSPISGKMDFKELADYILSDGLRVRMQIQLHKIIWGENAKGV